MKTNQNRKPWSQPTVRSVERMKDAAGGNGSGVAKGSGTTEYQYDGPGS